LHQGVVDVAVARIENSSILIIQAVAVHIFDDREAEGRPVLLVALAPCAYWIFVLAGLEKHFRNSALVDARLLINEEPALTLAARVVDLLP